MYFTQVEGQSKATGKAFHLLLPEHTAHQKLAEAMHKQGAQMVTPAFANRRVDEPVAPGTYVMMPGDERDLRDGGALMVLDVRPDRPPLAIITSQAHHWQDALEWSQEVRHYETPDEITSRIPRWSEEELFGRLREQARDQVVRRTRFTFANRAGLAPGKEWI